MFKTINDLFVFLLAIIEVGCASGPDLRVDRDRSTDLTEPKRHSLTRGMTMYKTINVLYVLLLAIIEVGCAGGPDLRVDRDPSADLAAYRTFGFFERMTTDQARYSSITTARLKDATRARLESLGYVYDERNPDLRVNFIVRVADRQQLRSSGTPGLYGYRGVRYAAWGGYPYDLQTVDYKEGTLGVDLVDARRSALVWQGIAEGRLTDKVLRDPAAVVDEVIVDLFRQYPHAAVL